MRKQDTDLAGAYIRLMFSSQYSIRINKCKVLNENVGSVILVFKLEKHTVSCPCTKTITIQCLCLIG